MKSTLRPLALAALPLAFAACSSTGPAGSSGTATKTTEIPAAIAVPSGNTLAATMKASGLQNYECRSKPDAAGGYDWILVAPEAALKDESGALVGRHYGGPVWEHGDGSKVSGRVLATTPSPVAGNLAWVLLQGSTSSGAGAFGGVTYIQRTNTNGGITPSDVCSASAIGTKKAVRYTADYRFYKS